jgi:mannitol/fructose-specific phosphotransferase system IIA component (Ntr-type)
MKLTDFFHIESVIPELASKDRNGVIRELIQSLADHGAVDPANVDALVKNAIQRENQGSTGFGKGVAVPHVKHETIQKLVATIGRSSHGVDFAALDRAPVYTVFILLSPPHDPDAHLAAMEKIFRHLQRDNFRRFLRQADTQEAIHELLVEADEA